MKQWHRLHTWPPTWQPETDTYRELMEQRYTRCGPAVISPDGRLALREREIMRLPGADERWENWVQYTTGRLVPTFTRDGYKVADVPKPLFDKLKVRQLPRAGDAILTSCCATRSCKAAVDKGIERWEELRTEGVINVIYTKEVPCRPLTSGPPK